MSVRTDVNAARALGWASIGIGLIEMIAPRWVSRTLGIEDRPGLLRALGAREWASGLVILTEDQPSPQLSAGLWSRVAGDAMDLTLLGVAAKKTRNPSGLATVSAMVVGITVMDVLCAVHTDRLLEEHEFVGGGGTHRRGFAGRLKELFTEA